VGIAVGALGTDGKGYLLADLSGRHSPEQWAAIVNDAYTRFNADIVVAEGNFGGDMVRAVLQANNPDLPFKEVTASRGKVVRAEPFSTLYQRGRIHHVGYFPEAEDQFCGMTTSGYQGLRSPDRADTIIWAWAELFPSMTQSKKDENWTPPQKKTYTRKASRYDRR
jgi:phage terminase large subunit-like protein